MGILFVFSFLLPLLLVIPALTYFHAKELGRNPRKWLLISLVLPVIASIILSCLPDLSDNSQGGAAGSDH